MKKYLLMLGLAAATAFGSVSAQTAQATLSISTSNAGYFVENTPITLETSGGSGSGAVSWNIYNSSVNGGSCYPTNEFPTNWCACWLTSTPSGTYLDGQAGQTCEVVARKAASSGYLLATSATKSFKIYLRNLYLEVSNTTTTAAAGTPITLTTSGGSGSGAVTYAVTGTGCTLSGTALTGTAGASCSVIATKAATTTYFAATSVAKTFVNCPALVGSWTASASKPGTTVTINYTAPNTSLGWSSFVANVFNTSTTRVSNTSTSNPGTLTVNSWTFGSYQVQVSGTTTGGCTYQSPIVAGT